MKSLFAIFVLICLALPGMGVGRVVASPVCSAEVATFDAEQAACSCCAPGECGCNLKKSQTPVDPVPAAPSRSLSMGDVIFFAPTAEPEVGGKWRAVVSCGSRPVREHTRQPAPEVPLYIRHCARLW